MLLVVKVVHRIDDLENPVPSQKIGKQVVHRIDDLEIIQTLAPSGAFVVHRIDDLEIQCAQFALN